MKIYGTSDLYLAAYLKSKGMGIMDREVEGRRITFLFEDTPEREKLVRDFFNNGTVSVADYVHALQDVKSVVFNY